MFLEKMLQSQGFGSRKNCQQLIKNGAVMIEGEVIFDPKFKLKTEQLQYSVYGESYQYREKVYIALYKPEGYECSHQATHHFSVFELFDEVLLNRGIQCVGRLDQDTTGLLLLTDDGQFLQALTHPKKHVTKIYHLETADPIDAIQVQQLENGVELRNETGVFAASEVKLMGSNVLALGIHQGVYHQVKRMLAAVGNRVESLHRQKVGQLDLADLNLEKGEWCYLSAEQIQHAKYRQEHVE